MSTLGALSQALFGTLANVAKSPIELPKNRSCFKGTGLETAERSLAWFRKLASMRKTKAGGSPPKRKMLERYRNESKHRGD